MERFKLVVVFSIIYGGLYIDMAKPFNPILGETYQGWVNGCPVYGEQISHHPPISAFLMYGRGYRVSGTIEPKIDIGVKTATGVNEGEYLVRFDRFPKNTIRFRTMDGEMGGVSYGDRTFMLVGKSTQ